MRKDHVTTCNPIEIFVLNKKWPRIFKNDLPFSSLLIYYVLVDQTMFSNITTKLR